MSSRRDSSSSSPAEQAHGSELVDSVLECGGEEVSNEKEYAIAEHIERMEESELQTPWTLWYMNGDTKSHAYQQMMDSGNWAASLRPLTTINTVEGFWRVINHVAPPSKLRVKNDYMLFREGIKPQWEDPANKNGGSWKLLIPSKYRTQQLDQTWLETLMPLIGESLAENGDLITGAYLQRRQKEDRVAIWTSTTDERVRDIGQGFAAALSQTITTTINFNSHEEQYSDNRDKPRHSSWSHRNKHVKYTVQS